MKPRLAVIAYPSLDETDRVWLDAVRAKHDPQFGMLAAHFTLVFPVDMASSEVLEEVASVAKSTLGFPFVLRSVKAVRDSCGPGGHVFLVPDEGADQIATLHARLYAGALKPAHRSDIQYLPHITVGADPEWSRCAALADELKRDVRVVAGRIEAISLVEVSGAAVSRTGVFQLSSPWLPGTT